MKYKIQKIILFLVLVSFLAICGCAVAVLGIGAAGAGAFAYINGKLTKTYKSEYNETVHASRHTLQKLKIPVTEIIADELTTEIKAIRPNDTQVAIQIVRIDKDHTQVSVRTGSLGVWDKRVSEQIHGYISQNLNQGNFNDEKLLGNNTQDEIRPPFEEITPQEIVGENPEGSSVDVPVIKEYKVNPGVQVQEEPSPEFVKIATESIYVIFFRKNSVILPQEAINKLDTVFEILKNNSRTKIMLNGYSDSIGSASHNKMISEMRANSVKNYLVGKGIQPSRIKAFGYGSQKFIASNKTVKGRQLNRRVEIQIDNP